MSSANDSSGRLLEQPAGLSVLLAAGTRVLRTAPAAPGGGPNPAGPPDRYRPAAPPARAAAGVRSAAVAYGDPDPCRCGVSARRQQLRQAEVRVGADVEGGGAVSAVAPPARGGDHGRVVGAHRTA